MSGQQMMQVHPPWCAVSVGTICNCGLRRAEMELSPRKKWALGLKHFIDSKAPQGLKTDSNFAEVASLHKGAMIGFGHNGFQVVLGINFEDASVHVSWAGGERDPANNAVQVLALAAEVSCFGVDIQHYLEKNDRPTNLILT